MCFTPEPPSTAVKVIWTVDLYQSFCPIVPESAHDVTGGSKSSFATIFTSSTYHPSLSDESSDINLNRILMSPPIQDVISADFVVHPPLSPVNESNKSHDAPSSSLISRVPKSPSDMLYHVEKTTSASNAFERSIAHELFSTNTLSRFAGYMPANSSPHQYAMLLGSPIFDFTTRCHQSPALNLSIIHFPVPSSKSSLKRVVPLPTMETSFIIHPLSVMDSLEKNLNLITTSLVL